MSLNVILTIGDLGANYCWPGPQQFANDMVAAMLATLPGTFTGFNFGPNVPAVEDQDKPWIKTDASGHIIRIYTFTGAWLAPHPISAGTLAIPLLWLGSESDLWLYDEGDGTDPATPGFVTDTTGSFWEVEHTFDFRFPVGPGTNGTAYDGGGANSISVGGTGGEERHINLITEISHTHTANVVASGVGASGYNVAASTNTGSAVEGVIKSHQNMPPYKGIYFCKRTARKYYVG